MAHLESVPMFWRRMKSLYSLIGVECLNCGKKYFPPRLICPECGGKEMKDYRFKGTGKVVSYSIIDVPPKGLKYQTPYGLAIVELDEGVRVTGQLVGCNLEEIKAGMRVETTFRKIIAVNKNGVIQYGYKFRPEGYPRINNGEKK
jgi:uncharacterized OB-fold protein